MEKEVQAKIEEILKIHNLKDIDSLDEYGYGVAHYAVSRGYVDVVEELLKIDEEKYKNVSKKKAERLLHSTQTERKNSFDKEKFEGFFYKENKITPIDYGVIHSDGNPDNILKCIDIIKSSHLYKNHYANTGITELLFGDKHKAEAFLLSLLPEYENEDKIIQAWKKSNNITKVQKAVEKIQDIKNNHFIIFFLHNKSLISACSGSLKEKNGDVYDLLMEIIKQDISKITNKEKVGQIQNMIYFSIHSGDVYSDFEHAIRRGDIDLLNDILITDRNYEDKKFIDQVMFDLHQLINDKSSPIRYKLNALSYAIKNTENVEIIRAIAKEKPSQLYENNTFRVDVDGENKDISTLQIICEECANSKGEKKEYLYGLVKSCIYNKPEMIQALPLENNNEIANVVVNAYGQIIEETDTFINNLSTMYKETKTMTDELKKIINPKIKKEVEELANLNNSEKESKNKIAKIQDDWKKAKKEYNKIRNELTNDTKNKD